MDNSLNRSIIEKVITKNVAIRIALNTMCPPQFEDKFRNESLCQKNTQTQNLGKSLNVVEPNNVNVANDTMNNTKTNLEVKSWRDITDPKLRKKMRLKEERSRYRKKYKDKIKLQKKAYYEINKEKISLKNKLYRSHNKDESKNYQKIYREVHKDKLKAYGQCWRKTNRKRKPKLSEKECETKRLNRRIANRLRQRLCKAIDRNSKNGSAVKDLGCTIEEFKVYLENKFQPGMNWDNWTIDGWHIDHIKPLSSFDLSDRKQMLEACHYTNLQPLWASDNLSKSDKIN